VIVGHEHFRQLWFAGNHSDIGGSYAETESRLSDSALAWMIEEATVIPNGLKVGPVFANGEQIPNTGDKGTPLNLYPAADGIQHCEVEALKDSLDAKLWEWVRPLAVIAEWRTEIREIRPDATLHPTVAERFALADVKRCAGFGPYRPEALRNHDDCKARYEAVAVQCATDGGDGAKRGTGQN
jgi:hypothetical protein